MPFWEDFFKILEEKKQLIKRENEYEIIFKTLNNQNFIANMYLDPECLPKIYNIKIITNEKTYEKAEALKYLIDNHFLRDVKGKSDLERFTLKYIKLLILQTLDYDLVFLTLHQITKTIFFLLDYRIDKVSALFSL